MAFRNLIFPTLVGYMATPNTYGLFRVWSEKKILLLLLLTVVDNLAVEYLHYTSRFALRVQKYK